MLLLTSVCLASIFVSYSWTGVSQTLARRAAVALETMQYKVWLDTRNMSGDVQQCMREGIEKAACVLVFMSAVSHHPSYQRSLHTSHDGGSPIPPRSTADSSMKLLLS